MVFVLVKQKDATKGAYIDWEFTTPITENVSVESKLLAHSNLVTVQLAGFSGSPPSTTNRLFNVELGQTETNAISISDRLFKWVNIKIDIDFANEEVSVYVDGSLVTTTSFENSGSQLSVVRLAVFDLDGEYTGMMLIDDVQIYSSTQTYLSVNFEDKTLGGGSYDDTRTDIYFIDEPFIFDWNQATIQALTLPTGPTGTTSYRDPTILHDDRGFTVRYNGYFYMCPANMVSGDTDISHDSKAVLMKSDNLIDWIIVADLTQYDNLKPNGYNPTRADLMFDTTENKMYALVEVWDSSNNKYYALYEVPNIEDPSTWVLKCLSDVLAGGVPWLVRNPSTGTLEAWLEYRPTTETNYVLAKIEIDEETWSFGTIQIVYDVRESGWHIPNPSVIYGSDFTLVLTNPIYALGSITTGLFCVVSVPVATDDIAILKNGSWNDTSTSDRHETPRLLATQSMVESYNFWMMWWEGSFGSADFTMYIMTYGSPNINDIPNIGKVKIWDGSTWKSIKNIKYWDGSSWQGITAGYYWDGTQWVKFWP